MRLDWRLEETLGARERREVLRSLRDEIDADEIPRRVARKSLGAPRTLAAQYSNEAALRPVWSLGIITAGTTLAVYWAIFFTYCVGALAALTGSATDTARVFFLGIPIEIFATEDELGIAWTSNWMWILIPAALAAAALLLGSRAWRLIRLQPRR